MQGILGTKALPNLIVGFITCKDWKFLQNFPIQLDNQPQLQEQIQFNNIKNNVALLNGSEMALLMVFSF